MLLVCVHSRPPPLPSAEVKHRGAMYKCALSSFGFCLCACAALLAPHLVLSSDSCQDLRYVGSIASGSRQEWCQDRPFLDLRRHVLCEIQPYIVPIGSISSPYLPTTIDISPPLSHAHVLSQLRRFVAPTRSVLPNPTDRIPVRGDWIPVSPLSSPFQRIEHSIRKFQTLPPLQTAPGADPDCQIPLIQIQDGHPGTDVAYRFQQRIDNRRTTGTNQRRKTK